mgnify:FL=1
MTEIVFTRIVNSSKRFVSSKDDSEAVLRNKIAVCESSLSRNKSFLASVITSLSVQVAEKGEISHRFGRDNLGTPVIKLSKLLSWANKNNISSNEIIIDDDVIVIKAGQVW